MTLLGIDTSGKTASAALCSEDCILSQTSVYTKLTHSQVILPIVKDVLKNAGLELKDIDAAAVASGPGSYTGLRIGISAVKAICYALDKKCIGISTLEALAYNMLGHRGIICPVMKARADLMYTALFTGDKNSIKRLTDDEILPVSEIIQSVSKLDGNVILTGDGISELMKNDILSNSDNITFSPPYLKLQLASGICGAALAKGKEAFYSPDRLNASYLQITKAEKDLMK